jgi:hypothetical protein
MTSEAPITVAVMGTTPEGLLPLFNVATSDYERGVQ